MSENDIFSSKSFMVPCLVFNSLSHFEFIFCAKVCSNFIDSCEAVHLFQYHLLERLFSFLLCQRVIDHRYISLFLSSVFKIMFLIELRTFNGK